MFNLEKEPTESGANSFRHTNPLRQIMLEKAVSALAKDFRNAGSHEIADRKLVEKALDPKSGGKISGRTALITEKALANYVARLKQENRDLIKKIDSRKNVNEEEANAQIRKNDQEIVMIEKNCLSSLCEINDPIVSPEEIH